MTTRTRKQSSDQTGDHVPVRKAGLRLNCLRGPGASVRREHMLQTFFLLHMSIRPASAVSVIGAIRSPLRAEEGIHHIIGNGRQGNHCGNLHLPLDPYPFCIYKPDDSAGGLTINPPPLRCRRRAIEPNRVRWALPVSPLRNFGDRIPCRRQHSRPWLSMLARNYLGRSPTRQGNVYSRAVSSTFADNRPSCSSTRCRYS